MGDRNVGIVDGEIMLDLNYEEDARAEVDMNLVMTGGRRFIEVQATAEQRPFDDAQLQRMMELARKGIQSLIATQQALLKDDAYLLGVDNADSADLARSATDRLRTCA